MAWYPVKLALTRQTEEGQFRSDHPAHASTSWLMLVQGHLMDHFEQHVDLDLNFILPPPQEKEGWMGWGRKKEKVAHWLVTYITLVSRFGLAVRH